MKATGMQVTRRLQVVFSLQKPVLVAVSAHLANLNMGTV